jgi:CRP-like cAMP-binding protein
LFEPLRILLDNRALSTLIVAFALLTMAEWGWVTALAIEAFQLNGAIGVGLVGLRLFIAAIASILSVPFVERQAGRHTLTIIAVMRACIVTISAVLIAEGASLAPLLVLVALDAVVSAPYRSAQTAVLPLFARSPTELAASAAGLSTVKTLSQALGATAGGALLAVTSPQRVFAGAGIVFVAVAYMTLQFVQPHRAHTEERSGNVARDTFRVIHEQHVTGIVVVSGLRTFVRGMWVAIAVIVSLQLLDTGSTGVGLLMLAAGVGSLTAVPLATTLVNRPRLGTPAAIALIACGLPLAILAGVPVLGVALVLVAAWAVGMAVADMTTLALLFRLLETPLLPRVTSGIESAKLALEGLGAFIAPVLVTVIGVRGALIAAAIPLPVVVILRWRVLHEVDHSAGERQEVLELLHGVPCLETLDLIALESLAGRVSPVSVSAGAEVVTQGDHGDRFYIVRSGRADVLVDDYLVGHVDAGGSFGEKALLRAVARTATVRSSEPMNLLTLSRDDFLASLDLTDGVIAPDVHRRTAALRAGSRRERVEVLANVSLLSHLGPDELNVLAEGSTMERWPPGTTIVRRGDIGDVFYVLLDGRADVIVDGTVVAELHAGDQFGEIALLHDVPRTADVTAVTPAATLGLHADDFLPAVRARILLG